MKRTILLIALFSLVAAPAFAQYNVYLKNGSVIRGVASYEEVDGELRFTYMGGTVGIPSDSVIKVEEAKTGGVVIEPQGRPGIRQRGVPVVPEYQRQTAEPPSATAPIKRQLAEIDARLSRIATQTAKYDDLKKEYDQVRLRIEVLFQKGIAEAKKKSGDPAKWFLFLPEQERQWVQLNTLKKNSMKREIEELEKTIEPLLKEKESLLEQRQELQQQLKEAEYPY